MLARSAANRTQGWALRSLGPNLQAEFESSFQHPVNHFK